MSSLLVYSRVYRLDIQSIMLVFSTGFVNNCPFNRLSGKLSPLPPFLCEKVYTVYTYTVCKGREYGVIGGEEGLRQIKHLPQSPFTGQFLKITTFGITLSTLSALQGPGEADPLWGQLSGLGHARDRVLVRF